MQLPFTADQFFDVFERYNSELPYISLILAIVAVVGAVAAVTSYVRLSLTLLALLWLWTGIVYHMVYFAEINPAAYLFGALFVLQGIFFGIATLAQNGDLSHGKLGLRRFFGAFLIVFSLVAYPAVGYLAGHVFPRSPTFGLPCPLTIYTFGMFLLMPTRIPLYMAVIPLVWSAIGTTAAFLLGVSEDLSLAVAAIVFVVITAGAKLRTR